MSKPKPTKLHRRRQGIRLGSPIRPLRDAGVVEAMNQWAQICAGDETTAQLTDLTSPDRRIRLTCECCKYVCWVRYGTLTKLGPGRCPSGNALSAVVTLDPQMMLADGEVGALD